MIRVLAFVVVFVTTYSLVLPTITLTDTDSIIETMDGVRVQVEYAKNILDKGMRLEFKKILLPDEELPKDAEEDAEDEYDWPTDDEEASIHDAALDGDETLQAEILKVMNITLRNEAGVEVEPARMVSLTLEWTELKDAKNPVLVYLNDDGERNWLTPG